MGAWIETVLAVIMPSSLLVAPCVGAWIETNFLGLNIIRPKVAPCVGAWIETRFVDILKTLINGRTLRGCVD